MLVELPAENRPVLTDVSAIGRSSVAPRPTLLVFDSGLGGLTVLSEIAKLRPDSDLVYAADDAGFPYGAWAPRELTGRVVAIIGRLITDVSPDAVVIACNTASTLVLAELRQRFPHMPFVGTVPAIKPAAAASRSKLISVLATPGTVARDYTRGLIDSFAADCVVTLVGSTRLASLAEAAMTGAAIADDDILAEIAPCFKELGSARTDHVVLACTHYPLLRDRFERLAPWPVAWIDPAPAIARRVDSVLCERGLPGAASASSREGRALFTSGRSLDRALSATLDRYGLRGSVEAMSARA